MGVGDVLQAMVVAAVLAVACMRLGNFTSGDAALQSLDGCLVRIKPFDLNGIHARHVVGVVGNRP